MKLQLHCSFITRFALCIWITSQRKLLSNFTCYLKM